MPSDAFFSFKAWVTGMRDTLAQNLRRARDKKRIYVASGELTAEQRAEFDAAFKAMDVAFLEMNKAFDHADRAFASVWSNPRRARRTTGTQTDR